MHRRKSSRAAGFTIVEVVVAAFLVGLGVTGMVSVLGTVSKTEARIFEKERVEKAADEKINELIATGEILTDGSGVFEDEEDADLSWSNTYEETGTENLAFVQVTVTKGDATAVAERLIFVAPEPVEEEGEGAAAPTGAAP